MTESNSRGTLTQQLLPAAVAGDEAAVDALLRHSRDRLLTLTRRMLGDFRRVRRWTDSEDVLQNALVRLLNTLRDVKPRTPRDFLALATLQIRRELIDLVRHYYGPEGIGAHHDSAAPEEAQHPGLGNRRDGGQDPASLAQWRELHQQIDALPEEEREVVGLLFYQGLSQAEAAELLGVSVRTVQRRWHVALCKLHRVWQGE
jgi:RNA polymerase sigma-70 factor (ECF subfamily)